MYIFTCACTIHIILFNLFFLQNRFRNSRFYRITWQLLIALLIVLVQFNRSDSMVFSVWPIISKWTKTKRLLKFPRPNAELINNNCTCYSLLVWNNWIRVWYTRVLQLPRLRYYNYSTCANIVISVNWVIMRTV